MNFKMFRSRNKPYRVTMKTDEASVLRMYEQIKHPTVLGLALQTCFLARNCSVSHQATLVVQMYTNKEIARLRAVDIAPAIALFVSLGESLACEIIYAMARQPWEVVLQLRQASGFQYGFYLGFLQGLVQSSEFSTEVQQLLGSEFLQIMRHEDPERKLESSEFTGGLSNAVAAISGRFPFFGDRFMTEAVNAPQWLQGPFASRFVDGLLHKELSSTRDLAQKLSLWAMVFKARRTLLAGSPTP